MSEEIIIKSTIYCPDIECDSCTKLIGRKLNKIEGVNSYKFDSEKVVIEHTNQVVDKTLIDDIKKLGFRADTQPFERKTFGERIRDFKENKHKYELESLSFKYTIIAFFLLCFIELIAYFGIFWNIPNFIDKYGIWLLYINLSVAVIGGSVWHFYSHRPKVTCMTGMMIGMTVSMQTGMLIGAILGATNGFFIGAFVGMIVATFVGTITGKSGGIMGTMEGMMGGVMGGTMGPMITVMMFSDNLHIFMPFYILINLIIMMGMTYMVYEEAVEGKLFSKKKPIEFTTFISIVFIVTFAIVALMMYGPKSPLVSF